MENSQAKSAKEVRKFYNSFAENYLFRDFLALNRRHMAITNLCDRYIPSDAQILEIGCGVGILSKHLQRLARKIVSVDISDVNVSIASAFAHSPINDFYNIDVTENQANLEKYGQFETILLADVLEHIPPPKQALLFQSLESLLAKDGLIIITVPSPQYQEYLKRYSPEKLQVIDETITLEDLLSLTTLDLLYFSYVDIWGSNQYLHVVLKKNLVYLHNLQDKRSFLQKVHFKFFNFWWRLQNRKFVNNISNEIQKKRKF
jgi:trans-aconitate 2-methyltransferase